MPKNRTVLTLDIWFGTDGYTDDDNMRIMISELLVLNDPAVRVVTHAVKAP